MRMDDIKTGNEVSIFQYIKRMAEEYPGLPYNFQDVETAGSRDTYYILWEDEMNATEKEKMAMDLMEFVSNCIGGANAYPKLRSMLEERPLFLYLSKLNSRIRLLIAEKLINETALYSFGLRLATESSFMEEVKLGMLLLGFFENDVTRKIMKKLGFHSSLTIYAVEASKNYNDQNDFLFELLQNTRGYGKLAALTIFEPVLLKHQRWILEKGALNEITPNMSAIMCLEKVDMSRFYQNLVITETCFSEVSYLLANAAEENDIKRFSQSLMLVQKYIDAGNSYSKEFIDLAAIVTIKNSMAPCWYKHGVDVEKDNNWSSNKENEIRNKCIELLKQPRWKNVLLRELSQPSNPTSLILLVMRDIGLHPAFDTFVPLLNKDNFDMDVLKFVLIDNYQKYLDEVLFYLSVILPEEIIFEGPKDIESKDVSADNKPDIWLLYLLKALRKEHRNEEKLFIRCLSNRLPDVRVEAIHALRVFQSAWSEDVLTSLEQSMKIEPVSKINKRIQRLLGKSNEPEKEQRYVDTSDIIVRPSSWDICLLETTIAGTFYHDMIVMEGRIENGDVLYLIREPENKYDLNAILVSAEDGYVLGYIPKKDNTIPASMMDDGEKLYAVFNSDNLEEKEPKIKIMLSKPVEKAGKVIELSKFYRKFNG